MTVLRDCHICLRTVSVDDLRLSEAERTALTNRYTWASASWTRVCRDCASMAIDRPVSTPRRFDNDDADVRIIMNWPNVQRRARHMAYHRRMEDNGPLVPLSEWLEDEPPLPTTSPPREEAPPPLPSDDELPVIPNDELDEMLSRSHTSQELDGLLRRLEAHNRALDIRRRELLRLRRGRRRRRRLHRSPTPIPDDDETLVSSQRPQQEDERRSRRRRRRAQDSFDLGRRDGRRDGGRGNDDGHEWIF